MDVWVRTHAGRLLPHPPAVFLGECFVHEAPEPRDTPAAFCSMRAWRAAGDDRAVERVRRWLTGIVGQEGFRGCGGFSDGASGEVIAVALFDTEERARHGHGSPGGPLWSTTGGIAAAARTPEDLRGGFW